MVAASFAGPRPGSFAHIEVGGSACATGRAFERLQIRTPAPSQACLAGDRPVSPPRHPQALGDGRHRAPSLARSRQFPLTPGSYGPPSWQPPSRRRSILRQGPRGHHLHLHAHIDEKFVQVGRTCRWLEGQDFAKDLVEAGKVLTLPEPYHGFDHIIEGAAGPASVALIVLHTTRV